MLSRFSCVQLFVAPWTVPRQAPLSMGFPRQEYCTGLPVQPSPPPGNLPYPGIEPASPALQVDSLLSEPPDGGWEDSVRDFIQDDEASPSLGEGGHQCTWPVMVACTDGPSGFTCRALWKPKVWDISLTL